MDFLTKLEPVMTSEQINAFLSEVYPQLREQQAGYRVIDVSPTRVIVRLDANETHVRPGGTISGPSLFTLADIGGYACIMAYLGREALAVTTNLNINFVRKALPGPIDGYCRVIKLGKRLMVYDIEMVSQGEIVAQATGTYAIPPKK